MRLTWTTSHLATGEFFSFYFGVGSELLQIAEQPVKALPRVLLPALTLCTLHGGIKKPPARAAAQMYLVETCHTIISLRWLIPEDTGSLAQSFISTLLKLLQTDRNNISRHENQKGQKMELWQLSLSLLVLIFCRHALKPLPLTLAKTDMGLAAFLCVCSSRRPHHSISDGAHTLTHTHPPPLGFVQHLALWGWAPSSGGGLCRCSTSLKRTLRKTEPTGRAAAEQPTMFIMHQHLSAARQDAEGLLGRVLCARAPAEERVHSCLRMTMHCSMERLCCCGHSLGWEQLWFMVIVHTLLAGVLNTEHSYGFDLVYLFLSSCEEDRVVGRWMEDKVQKVTDHSFDVGKTVYQLRGCWRGCS